MSRNLAPASLGAPDDVVARVQDVVLSPAEPAGRTLKITFEVGANALLFLVGPTGSGKTAILDLLGCQALPARGSVEILGSDLARLSPSHRPRMRRRLGLLFEDRRLLPDIDVFANVALAARVARRRPRDYAEDVNQLLLWVGLGGRGADPVSRLTDGEKRRLCLARALLNRPELLVVDEPTFGLGDKAGRAVMRLILDVNKAGTPVVFATRDRSLAVDAGGLVYDMPAREAS